MIVLLGASGYVGAAFAQALRERGEDFTGLSRARLDYTRFDGLLAYLRQTRPAFLINAAGFTGKPNVDACEAARAETLQGNVLLPQTIAHACALTQTPWGHVSSGCIYSGAKVRHGPSPRVEKNLMTPEMIALRQADPGAIQGFSEADEPNFSFRRPPCSFYSGSKALAEEAILGVGQVYLWRMRIPFDRQDGPRNYLSKLQRYPKVYDNVNSLCHRGDFARACLDLWVKRAPFGIYNLTNPGWLTSRQVVARIQHHLCPTRRFDFWSNDDEFYHDAVKTLRSNCILDVSKALSTGIELRSVEAALEAALGNWTKEN